MWFLYHHQMKLKRISLHITRHGINATVHLVEGGSTDAGSILLEYAKALKSELIVMGPCGNSRIREQILGGTTNYMLEYSQLPILVFPLDKVTVVFDAVEKLSVR
jgi:nucleotide-binding universal stress UspA family protein